MPEHSIREVPFPSLCVLSLIGHHILLVFLLYSKINHRIWFIDYKYVVVYEVTILYLTLITHGLETYAD